MQRLKLEDMRRLARSRGGDCHSTEYVNARSALEWSCAAGHRWSARPVSVRAGTWCPRCSGRREAPLAELGELAARHGGRCLSSFYANPGTRIRWRCRRGHVWEASAASVRRGSWCPTCKAPSIAECRRLARSRGGACLSISVRHVHDELLWRCGDEHEWRAPLERVRRGTWCRLCADAALRGKSRPRIGLADARALAQARGGECLSDDVASGESELNWRCAEGHCWSSPYRNVRRGGWCPECRRRASGRTAEAMRALAAARGGRLLSQEYERCDAKLEWECALGHRWLATPHKVQLGTWCPGCADNHRGSLAEMRSLAASRGGACVSRRYVNCSTKLGWRCAQGHEWEAIPASVKAGRWCPRCSLDRSRSLPRDSARAGDWERPPASA